jgi:hypothetical protein
MYKTWYFWLVLYVICLVYTIISLFNKLYRDNEDKHSIDPLRKVVANLDTSPPDLISDLSYDFEYFLNRSFWHNVLLYIVIKPLLGVCILSAIYFITIFFSD